MAVLEKVADAARTSGTGIRNFDLEFICHIYLRLKRLNDIFIINEVPLSIETFSRIYRKSIGTSRIPFVGEPLSGIQVMGVLETRLLDFKNVILLSMNEGYFPKKSASPSFIPPYLRYAFGMPTIEHQDNIYAYYFYRLLQRTDSVSLLYNNNTEGMHKGERSRYIYQLQYDPLISSGQNIVGLDVRSFQPPPLKIVKNKRVMEKLAAFYTDERDAYLSPSALNDYLECGLRFFFRYMAGIREAPAFDEEVDAATFGSILHAVITGLYAGLPEQLIREKDMNMLLGSEAYIRQGIEKAFRAYYHHTGQPAEMPDPGTNILVREVLFEYVRNILREDMKHVPISLIEQEHPHYLTIPVATDEGVKPVRIGGRIDRVDATEGLIRIIDYKTGAASVDFTGTEQLFARNDSERNKAAFQVLLYCRMYQADHPESQQQLVPGLYAVQKMYDPSYEYRLKRGEKYKPRKPLESFLSISDEFEQGLLQLLEELYDLSVPFMQTEDAQSCRYCPYAGICYRGSKDD
jgi:hypothetical protein